MQKVNTFVVQGDNAGQRLDVFLSEQGGGLTRSRIQKLIADSMVKVNGDLVRSSYKVRSGDIISLVIPPPKEIKVEAENIPLDIYYEDADVIIVNKPRGLVVHPADGNWNGTLVNALLYHCKDLSGINGEIRPGIVHRLDKDTSGLLIVAKNDDAHLSLARQLKDHSVVRGYLALVHGKIKGEKGMIDAPIGRHPVDRKKMAVVERNSRQAVTHYRVLDRKKDYTLVDLRLETGRTHQIRVHMNYINHPVVGDTRYGPGNPHFGLNGQFLHAYRLGFIHPRSGRYMEFNAPLPEVLENILIETGFDVPPVTALSSE
jgi:23S rRNA pseudouridine1911/1915/1917 synthase